MLTTKTKYKIQTNRKTHPRLLCVYIRTVRNSGRILIMINRNPGADRRLQASCED